MPTTLYYTDTLASLAITGKVVRLASLTRGSGVVTKTQDTSASGSAINVYDTGTTQLVFAMRVNAYTATTGTYSFNHWGRESNAMANYTAGMGTPGGGGGFGIQTYDDAGNPVAFLVSGAWISATEYGTTAAARTDTSTAGSAASVPAGDWIVIGPRHEPIGTGASGYTCDFNYNGTTAAASGDTYVTCPDTITEYVESVAGVPYSTPYPQLLAH